jgi:hypothetical protein
MGHQNLVPLVISVVFSFIFPFAVENLQKPTYTRGFLHISLCSRKFTKAHLYERFPPYFPPKVSSTTRHVGVPPRMRAALPPVVGRPSSGDNNGGGDKLGEEAGNNGGVGMVLQGPGIEGRVEAADNDDAVGAVGDQVRLGVPGHGRTPLLVGFALARIVLLPICIDESCCCHQF